MDSLRNSGFVKRHRPKIFALLWFVFGIVLVMMAAQSGSIPGRDDLVQVSGTIDKLDESTKIQRGPNLYTLYLRLQGSGVEYVIDNGRRAGSGAYFRASGALRRGSSVTLWYERHDSLGNRLWQIDQQGQRLLHYREVFDHETDEQMKIYLFLIGYLVASLLVIPLLLGWHGRVKARYAEPHESAEKKQ
ncbi:MAG: hypothetical protein K2Y31_06610 [Burkholderiales bacterium]|jgi:hypothetical protein|nr:hypothetical protein [Burkholderiales bacterium]